MLETKGVSLSAQCAQHDGIDFFCSLDERFRPVSLCTGPDGALYVVDLYHGIVQHGAYMSAYLADQVKKRDLDKNEGHRGRIWRIVSDTSPPGAWPHLSSIAPTAELVKNLSHPNGWWRDTSQRLLVERGNGPASVPTAAESDGGEVRSGHGLEAHATVGKGACGSGRCFRGWTESTMTPLPRQ